MVKKLWVDPPSHNFKHHQEGELQETLELMDRNLALSPITSVQDVTLDGDARAGGRYHLTRWSLFQLCQLLCPGLYGFVAELSGAHRPSGVDREEYSFEEALDTVNRVIHRRFRSRLSDKMMLRNTKDGTIDGFVGATYKWFANHEFFGRAQAAINQAYPGSHFAEATLNGRWLLFRFLLPRPRLKFDTQADDIIFSERFYQGFHFSNNEVGKASVRAARTLYRKISQSSSLEPISISGHVRHRGTKFQNRVDRLIAGVIHAAYPAGSYYNALECIRSTSLGLGNPHQAVEERRLDDLVAKLTRRHIPVSIAKVIMSNVIAQSSYEEEPPPYPSDVKNRTVYDLYNAMGRVAVDLPINHRERVEQTAHSVLMGKIGFE